uniref:Uncharacterized protein n=1 Tax=viral metagenome TaxID=1070528 RepID=A0A6C0B0L8_9ZZZZ
MEFIIPPPQAEKIIENPKICFALVCKDEEKCILTALESVYKFISYWVICDTGSTDKTCELIENFFKEKEIPGELFHESWVNFGYNKTLLFDRCYKKADYILHFDADDYFVGDLKFVGGKTQYYINVKKNDVNYPCFLLFDCNYKWKFCGVAHTTIKCLDNDNPTLGYLITDDFYMYSSPDTGARSFDPEKYKKDAEKLKTQFFDTLIFDPDNLNTRSIFYTAQSYRDHGDLEQAAKWYNLYLKIKDTWIEEQYMCYFNLGNIYKSLKYDFKLIEKMYLSAIELINDRAEAYYHLGILYNQTNNQEYSYNLLLKAKNIKFEETVKKYVLFLDSRCYGKYILDELSVACYWTNRIQEGIEYLSQIIDDPDMDQTRLQENMKHFKNKLNTD